MLVEKAMFQMGKMYLSRSPVQVCKALPLEEKPFSRWVAEDHVLITGEKARLQPGRLFQQATLRSVGHHQGKTKEAGPASRLPGSPHQKKDVQVIAKHRTAHSPAKKRYVQVMEKHQTATAHISSVPLDNTLPNQRPCLGRVNESRTGRCLG